MIRNTSTRAPVCLRFDRWPGLVVLISLLVAVSACSTLTSSGAVDVDGQARWSVLSFDNLSVTPLAGRSAQALVETRLRQRGVVEITRMQDRLPLSLAALINDEDTDPGLDKARLAGHRYALGGTVHEWRYKDAPDREAVVGLSLQLTDLSTNRVVWQGTRSRTGWGRASLSTVADKTIAELLGHLDIALAR